jgi:quercetin dioxygenase-like cupin family protein
MMKCSGRSLGKLKADQSFVESGTRTWRTVEMFRKSIVAALGGFMLAPVVHADQIMSAAHPLESIRFEADSDVKCLLSAVETGDPNTGPSTIVLKAPAGCVVPWHFHTAQEQAVVIQGVVKMEMPDSPATLLGPGGFAVMRGKVPHQFACAPKVACLIMVSFDATYDIVWGRGSG